MEAKLHSGKQNKKATMRRVICALLVLLLIISLTPVGAIPAFAAETPASIVLKTQETGELVITNKWKTSIVVSQSEYPDYTVDRGSSLARSVLAGQIITVKESNPGKTFREWDFSNSFLSNVSCAITSMPAMSSFTEDNAGSIAGDYFFNRFCGGATFGSYASITSLPSGSFNTSSITTTGVGFFGEFNSYGSLTSLPSGSFNTSSITTTGVGFFDGFNKSDGYHGQLFTLPSGSFRIPNITTAEGGFFYGFNYGGALTSLPDGSFNTSNISDTGDFYFSHFNYSGALTSLPNGSFNTSKISSVGDYFFYGFNDNGCLTTLPTGSFDTSKIKSVGNYFFSSFNYQSYVKGIISLPASFKLPEALSSADSNYCTRMFSGSLLSKGNQQVSLYFARPAENVFLGTDISPASPYSRQTVYVNGYTEGTVYCVITLESQGGDVAYKYKPYVKGSTLADLPIPTSSNHSFRGWWTQPGGGFQADASTIVQGDITYYAHWEADPITYCTITFNAQGGNVNPTSKAYESGLTLGTLPTPTKTGYTFKSWNSKPDGTGTLINSTMVVNSDMTIYAIWEVIKSNAKEITSFKLNEVTGKISGTNITLSVPYGTAITSLKPTVTCSTKATYTPTTAQNFTSPVKYTVSAEDGTTKVYTVTVTKESPKKVNVSFNYNYTASPATKIISIDTGKAIGASMPKDPVRSGYTFKGWWSTSTSGGVQATTSTIVTSNATYYARWAPVPIYYTITFNPQGGSVSPASIKFEANTTFGTLPIPKKAGYVFESWNSKSDGSGTPYYSATSVNANIVAYAIWRLPSKEKDIISFSLKGKSATISGTNITVTLPHNTSITSLTPSIAYSENATITPQGAQNFTSPVKYTVSAEDGTTKVYTVTVKVEAAPITPPKADTKVKVTKVSLATTPPVYLVKGKTLTLKASVQPYNATNKKLTFKSLSPKIVKVDKNTGKMKALKTGKARIVVTSVDGKKKAACTIIVVAKTLKVKALKSFSPLTLTVGKTKQIKAKVTPAKATGVMPAYSSSNKKVATIDKAGVITAHKKGTATITVKAGGKTKTFKVIVR